MPCIASTGKGKLTTEVTFNPFKEVREKDTQSLCHATHECRKTYLAITLCLEPCSAALAQGLPCRSTEVLTATMQVEPQLEALSGTGNGISEVPEHSLARVDYALEAEYGVNEQVQHPLSHLSVSCLAAGMWRRG